MGQIVPLLGGGASRWWQKKTRTVSSQENTASEQSASQSISTSEPEADVKVSGEEANETTGEIRRWSFGFYLGRSLKLAIALLVVTAVVSKWERVAETVHAIAKHFVAKVELPAKTRD
jgi:hypothetical protein